MIVTTSLRVMEKQAAAIRKVYADTYPQHQLSYNKWLLLMVERGMKAK